MMVELKVIIFIGMCIACFECQINVIIRSPALTKLRFKIFVFMALVWYLLNYHKSSYNRERFFSDIQKIKLLCY